MNSNSVYFRMDELEERDRYAFINRIFTCPDYKKKKWVLKHILPPQYLILFQQDHIEQVQEHTKEVPYDVLERMSRAIRNPNAMKEEKEQYKKQKKLLKRLNSDEDMIITEKDEEAGNDNEKIFSVNASYILSHKSLSDIKCFLIDLLPSNGTTVMDGVYEDRLTFWDDEKPKSFLYELSKYELDGCEYRRGMLFFNCLYAWADGSILKFMNSNGAELIKKYHLHLKWLLLFEVDVLHLVIGRYFDEAEITNRDYSYQTMDHYETFHWIEERIYYGQVSEDGKDLAVWVLLYLCKLIQKEKLKKANDVRDLALQHAQQIQTTAANGKHTGLIKC